MVGVYNMPPSPVPSARGERDLKGFLFYSPCTDSHSVALHPNLPALLDKIAISSDMTTAAAVPVATTLDHVDGEKENDVVYRDFTVDEEGKRVSVDYSGAHEKTDPAEIKLVRKLDKWIMVNPLFPLVFSHH
jgi:hypothetical protein